MTINYQQPFYQNPFGNYYPPTPYGCGMPMQPPFGPYPGMTNPNLPVVEQSYIENILRLNRGKQITVYMSFEGSQWGSKIFKGELQEAGRDHIVLKDNQTNITYLLLTIYLSYVTFEGNIEYEYPFSGV